MELARRHLAVALIAAGALVATAAALAALRPRTEQAASHAFPVPPADDRVLVEVLNGTNRPGLARAATRALRRHGLDVVFFGTTDSAGRVDSSLVLVRRGSVKAGARVAGALGAGKVLLRTDTLRRVDVSVIVGEDYQPRGPLHP
ncbi:MAG TPA: LytR C-terminal domain-containing protein [Gemmatimonadales bacterium]|nr:LytR C-terminal domain-containing protein [Gemmatimonadales bacterium]